MVCALLAVLRWVVWFLSVKLDRILDEGELRIPNDVFAQIWTLIVADFVMNIWCYREMHQNYIMFSGGFKGTDTLTRYVSLSVWLQPRDSILIHQMSTQTTFHLPWLNLTAAAKYEAAWVSSIGYRRVVDIRDLIHATACQSFFLTASVEPKLQWIGSCLMEKKNLSHCRLNLIPKAHITVKWTL